VDFYPLLSGRQLTGARPVGGMVEIMFESVSLAVTDGANLLYTEPPGKLPKTFQLLIGFTDQSCLTAAVRMYAGFILFEDGKPEGTLADYYLAAISKPQVLSDGFTREYFHTLAADPGVRSKSVKALLATGQRIPGLGNGVLQDILFNAGVHPKAKVDRLGRVGIDRLYDSITYTLARMAARGGRESETDLFGSKGGYTSILSKDTAGTPCPECGTVIVKENYMGGSIYYCPVCQPL
ncbi:MAG: endonuclease VIII, partial [Rikenellaceae bacterium]|nr:endonuclease VIII [Rikenellaceae bacterium]